MEIKNETLVDDINKLLEKEYKKSELYRTLEWFDIYDTKVGNFDSENQLYLWFDTDINITNHSIAIESMTLKDTYGDIIMSEWEISYISDIVYYNFIKELNEINEKLIALPRKVIYISSNNKINKKFPWNIILWDTDGIKIVFNVYSIKDR